MIHRIINHIIYSFYSTIWYLWNISLIKQYFDSNDITNYRVELMHLWKPNAKYFSGYLISTNQKIFVKFGAKLFIQREYDALQYLSALLPSISWLPIIINYDLNWALPNITFKFIDGIPLNKIDKNNISPVLQKNLITTFKEICNSLYPLGLAHRDIRPHNIIIDKDNSVYLIDFAFMVGTNKQYTSLQELPNTPENIDKLYRLGNGYNPKIGIWDDAYSCMKILTEFGVDDSNLSQVSEFVGKLSIQMVEKKYASTKKI